MKFIKREFEEKYFALLDKNFITVFLGPRRVGKSTFVKQYLEKINLKEKIYFNFDELSTREDIENIGLEKLIQINSQSNSLDKVIFIDEIQKEPKVFEQIKIIYDKQKHSNHRYKFILTGSSSLNIQKNVSESLAGRVEILKIHPFLISEALKLKKHNIAENVEFNKILNPDITFEKLIKHKDFFELPYYKNSILQKTIYEIIEFGSLPETMEEKDIDGKRRYLRNYKDTYLEKDIKSSLNIGDLKGYSNLLTILASQVGNLINKTTYSEKTGLSTITVNKYISILENTYILNFLHPYIFSASKRLVKSPKAYLFDNGIISLLNGFINFEQLVLTSLIGSRFENLVINELKNKLEPYNTTLDFYFWRTPGGLEIDLIIDFKDKIIPCEIKWTDNPNQVQTKALSEFMKENKKAVFALVIYNGELYINKSEKIIFLPFSNLAISS